MNPNKPKLEKATFEFSQKGNCVDGGEYEILEIRCESSLGIDNDHGCFFVLKTEQWSIDSKDEVEEMLNRVGDAIKAALINNPHYDKSK